MPSPDINPHDGKDPAPFPLMVRVAGAMWAVFGPVTILAVVAAAVWTRFPFFTIPLLSLVSATVALQGVRAGCGRAPEVGGLAQHSLIAGLIVLALGGLRLATEHARPGVAGGAERYIIMGIMAMSGLAFLAAGGLALVGQPAYLR